MTIVIRNYLAASFLLEQEPHVWEAIIILDSGLSHTDFVAKHARDHIYLRFDDVDRHIPGKRSPTSCDVRTALEFGASTENLLVSCRAGQSRSAAVAYLIACQKLDPDTACRWLNPKRHIPNSLIIELGTPFVDDPAALRRFHEWQAANRHIKLSDHLDDIEHEFDELERQGARNRIVHS